jgi:hypothetical protein
MLWDPAEVGSCALVRSYEYGRIASAPGTNLGWQWVSGDVAYGLRDLLNGEARAVAEVHDVVLSNL